MSRLSLVDRLRSGTRVQGLWHQSGSELMVEMAARVGFDCLVVDNEHGPASIGDTLRLVRAADIGGADTLVRVGSHSRDELSRTLDTGAAGLIVPMVNSAADARQVVDVCRYAPVGNRGVAANVVRASGYGTRPEYLGEANRTTLLALQIETIEAVDALDDILAVDGYDMLFIGPGDLSASMGYIGQPGAPAVVARVAQARDRILKSGRLLGTVTRPDITSRALFAEGYNLVVDGSDIGLFRTALQGKLSDARAAVA